MSGAQMRTLTVLMYHATPEGEGEALNADAHYSVGLSVFEAHLDLMLAAGRRPASLEQALREPQGSVALTFDDGHETNAAAARAILARGGSATFFVNPSNVGTPGFLGWDELGRLARQGISVQSHGQHHRFLDELGAQDVEDELARSREEIQSRLGTRVTSYAPAGGRMPPRLDVVARRLGYEQLCTSVAGVHDVEGGDRFAIPRFAVLAATGLPQLRRWIDADPGELARQRRRHAVLSAAKRLLGNGTYVRARQWWLAARGRA